MVSNKLKSIFLLLIVMLVLPNVDIASAAETSSEITVSIDNRPVYFDIAPQKINDRVMVPLRAIFESLGAEVNWDDNSQTITGTKDQSKIVLRLNDKNAIVEGKSVKLSDPAIKIKGRTFVPARFVAESFGADVKWNESIQQVVIDTVAPPSDSFYYFVYNSKAVTAEDLAAIKIYINKFDKNYNVLVDSSKYTSANQIYDFLRADYAKRGGKVAGVQIFGQEKDVPTFHYSNKFNFIDPQGKYSHVENDKGDYVTDFFFSTFENDSKYLDSKLSVYSVFDEGTPVSLIPEWPVSRLLLTKGEIAGYINRYYDYLKQTEGKKVPLVAHSAPTFYRNWEYNQLDDGAFMIKKFKENFGLLKDKTFRAYGNKKGEIISSPESGELSAENIKKENEQGVADLYIEGHGGPHTVNQTVPTRSGSGKYDFSAKQIPFITQKTINDLLGKNFYTAMLWSCDIVDGLNGDNLVHEAMSKGKMISAIAGTSPIAGNGRENYECQEEDGYKCSDITFEGLKNNNPYLFMYYYFEGLDNGKSRLESFTDAQAGYAQELLMHQDPSKGDLWGSNFECGFGNILALQYIGLADY